MSAIVIPPTPVTSRRLAPVASWTHTVVVVSVFAALALAGVLGHAHVSANRASVASRPNTILIYVGLIAAEWALVMYVRRGVRRTGTTLVDLLGGGLSERRNLLSDLALGASLWGMWALIELASAHWWGASSGATVRPFLAHRPVEVVTWIVLSMSAGFAEEVVFRGYLQRQFGSLTGSAGVALVMQAALFGVSHGYQGPGACARIIAFGCLFGLVALWRRRLRPGIIAHALTDIIAGLA